MLSSKSIAGLIFTLFLVPAAAAQTDRPTRPTSLPENVSTGSVRGRVMLPGGAPISDPIKISLQTPRGTHHLLYTDLQGAFEIKDVEAGNYTLMAEADREQRFDSVSERILVQRRAPTVVTMYLKEKKAAADPKQPSAVVSVKELDKDVPAGAVKEFNRAGKAAADGKVPDAIAHLRKAIAIYPDYLMARNDLGTHLLSLGQLDEAEEQFRAAIKIDAKAFNPRLNLGIALVGQHKFSDAVTTLDNALSLDASSPSAHLYAGLAALGLDDLAKAEKALKAAYELGGIRFAPALFHLGQIYMSRGEREAALRAFEDYLRATPDSANAEQVKIWIGALRQP